MRRVKKLAETQQQQQKTKIRASDPITEWQIAGEKVKAVTGFIWGAPKSIQTVTAIMKFKDACSLEGKL